MKPFNQCIINGMAERDSENYKEYKLFVVVFTWLACNRGRYFSNKADFHKLLLHVTNTSPMPFYLLERLVLKKGYKVYITFPITGDYNVISNRIFIDKYTVDQRFNYIEAAANISPVHRLYTKLGKKSIKFSSRILTIPENTPLVTRHKNTIYFPYEEHGER